MKQKSRKCKYKSSLEKKEKKYPVASEIHTSYSQYSSKIYVCTEIYAQRHTHAYEYLSSQCYRDLP